MHASGRGQRCGHSPRRWPDFSAWQKVVRDAKAARLARHREQYSAPARRQFIPYQAVTAIADNLPPDSIVIGDGAESYHWLNEVIRQENAGSYITHGFLGAVGFGLGLSLGAQVAFPDRPVLCLVGDGAVGFTIAEFDTMVRHGLPIVVVVMNNRSWAASQHFQEIVSGRDNVLGTRLGDARYHDVARAFGANGVHITALEDLGPAIKARLREPQADVHQRGDRRVADPAGSRAADGAPQLSALRGGATARPAFLHERTRHAR